MRLPRIACFSTLFALIASCLLTCSVVTACSEYEELRGPSNPDILKRLETAYGYAVALNDHMSLWPLWHRARLHARELALQGSRKLMHVYVCLHMFG